MASMYDEKYNRESKVKTSMYYAYTLPLRISAPIYCTEVPPILFRYLPSAHGQVYSLKRYEVIVSLSQVHIVRSIIHA